MKILRNIGLISIMFFLASCDFMGGDLKRLDEKKIRNQDIEVNWFRTSSITTIHEHIEVSKSGKTYKIAELNEGGIEQIKIKSDTIIIETHGFGLFYKLDEKVFDYVIVLDTIK